MYSENIPVKTQVHQKKLNLLFPRSCNTDKAEMLLHLHHTDPTGEILRHLFAESLGTVNLYLLSLTRGFYSFSKGWSLFRLYISGNSKLNEKLRSCLVWGFCHITPLVTATDRALSALSPSAHGQSCYLHWWRLTGHQTAVNCTNANQSLLCLADICPCPWQGATLENL